MSVAVPDWRVTLDGEDLTDRIRPLLMRLNVSERREELADQLDIVLDDSGRTGERIILPPPGARITVELGWRVPPSGAPNGLVDMGSFVVDEVETADPAATIQLRARSADFTTAWRMRREAVWERRSLAHILGAVAGRHGLATRIEAGLGAIEPELVTQSRESDMALLQRLGKEHDAVATVKAGTLLFLPLAGGRTATGESLPAVTVRPSEGGGYRFRIAKREDYGGVVARWRDRAAATDKAVRVKGEERVKRADRSVSAGDAENPKVLAKIHATEAEARRAAEAEWARIRRAPRSLEIGLAFGRADISAEHPLIAEGFRPEIDAEDWIVASADHTLDARSGFTSAITCEVPASLAEPQDASE